LKVDNICIKFDFCFEREFQDMENITSSTDNAQYIQTNLYSVAKGVMKIQPKSYLEKNNSDTVEKKLNNLVKVLIPKINNDIEKKSPYLADLKKIDHLIKNCTALDCLDIFDEVKSLTTHYINNENLTEELANSINSYKLLSKELENHNKSIEQYKLEHNSIQIEKFDSVLEGNNLNTENESTFLYESDEVTEVLLEFEKLVDSRSEIIAKVDRELTKVYGYTKAILKINQEQIIAQEREFEEFYEMYLKIIIKNEYDKIVENLELSNSLGIPLSILIGDGGESDSLETCDLYIQNLDKFKNLSKEEIKQQLKHASSGPGMQIFQDDFLYYLSMFKNNKPLVDLLDNLGKKMGLNKSVEESYEEAYLSSKRNEIVSKEYKERISGITFGKQFEYMLPQELALLSDPEVELLFKLKFLENRITCFDLDSVSHTFDEVKKTRQSTRKKNEDTRGPVIVAIDTSSSMIGLPENYAKAVTLVLALKCLDAKRCLYAINFSDSITCKKFDYAKKKQSLTDLKQFLRMSYHGGTTINSALTETLKILGNDKDFKNADMLVCTDGFLGGVNNDLIQNALDKNKKSKTNFYELIVGYNPSPKKLFFNTVYTIYNGTLKVVEFDKKS
jgi:uncharacterized protein with von Willebrand factor type A (vWA) domain